MNKDPIQIYDARWETSEFSKKEVARLLESVYIYGALLGIDTVTIAKDARLAGSSVMEQAAELALESGLNVYLCTDQISTTQSYFMAFKVSIDHPKTMGLTITASHNPANYIGLKITVPGTQAIGLDCGPLGGFKKIREIYHSSKKMAVSDGGNLHIADFTEDYIKFSMETAGVKENMLNGLTVVLDSFHGAAGSVIHRSLKSAGVNILPLRIIPDGNFPTGAPNPVSRGKMDDAITHAKMISGSIVIGTDGDGDRIVFGDENGMLNAGFSSIPVLDILTSLSEYEESGTKPLYTIFDPKVNPVALNEWKKLGIEPRLFRNGHSQIKEFMRDIDAIAAIEESGHFYHKLKLGNHVMYGENSLLSILLFLRAVYRDPSTMKKLWDLQRQVHSTGEFNYSFKNDEIRDSAMDEVISYFKGKEASIKSKSLEGIDLQGTAVYSGIDLNGKNQEITDNWYSGYFRSSTTEGSVFRSYLSSCNNRLLNIMENDIIEICEKHSGIEVE